MPVRAVEIHHVLVYGELHPRMTSFVVEYDTMQMASFAGTKHKLSIPPHTANTIAKRLACCVLSTSYEIHIKRAGSALMFRR